MHICFCVYFFYVWKHSTSHVRKVTSGPWKHSTSHVEKSPVAPAPVLTAAAAAPVITAAAAVPIRVPMAVVAITAVPILTVCSSRIMRWWRAD